jgi:hypothetical protein
MELRIPTRFPNDFTSSGERMHTEPLIDAALTADPDIDNISDSIEIKLFFTERDPCPRCQPNVIPKIERKNGGPFTITWFVYYGPDSYRDLRQLYGFPEP